MVEDEEISTDKCYFILLWEKGQLDDTVQTVIDGLMSPTTQCLCCNQSRGR